MASRATTWTVIAMSDVEDMTLEEVEERLDELVVEKDAVERLHQRINDITEDIGKVKDHEFVDDDLTAKLSLIQQMFALVTHEDLNADRRIHHEREVLRRRKIELERQEVEV